MVFLGGAALMLWFRDQGWHWAGGLIAALAFSYGASMAWRIQHIGQVLSLAYLPIAMVCLDRALARGSILYGVAAGVVAACIVLGRDQVALLASICWRACDLAHPLGAGAAGRAARKRAAARGRRRLRGARHRRAGDADGLAGPGVQPPLDRLCRRGARLVASGAAADAGHARRFRRVGPHGGLLGTAELRLARYGDLPRPEHGRALYRRHSAAAAAHRRRARPAVGARDPVLRLRRGHRPRSMRSAGTRPSSASSMRCCPASASSAGRRTRRSSSARSAPSWPATARTGCCAMRARESARGPAIIAAATLAVAVLLAVALGLWLGRLPRLSVPLARCCRSFAAALPLAWAMPRMAINPLLAAVVLAGVTTVDLAYNNGPSSSTAQPPAMYEVLEPDTRNATIAILKSKVVADDTRRDRIELAGLGFHWPNASLTHRLENTLGYNPVRLALYSEATGAEDHVGLPDQRKFSPLFPSYRSTLANLLGLRFIATGAPIESMDPSLKAGDLPLVARTSDGYIYENPDAIPRVLFATEARAADFGRMLADGVWPDADLRTTVLLERPPRGRRHAPPARQRAHRQLPQHRGDPGGRQPRRRLGGAQRSLAPLVVRRGRRPAGGDPACQRPVPRGRGRPGDTRSVSTSARLPAPGRSSENDRIPSQRARRIPLPLTGRGAHASSVQRSFSQVGTSAGSLQIKSPAPKCDVGMKPKSCST